jgi:TetR/AcrR family transcriptional regulator, transcriptional repressor for nem operon
MGSSTKERLLEAGMAMLLERGYNDLGIQSLLERTGIPKGSFYHHFESKEDFALQVIDLYMTEVHQGLDMCLGDQSCPPLGRVRKFFELSREKYQREGYLGCLLGGVGQELSGVNEVFRSKIEWCFSVIAYRIADCLQEAQRRGEISATADPAEMADVLLNCWEGAALRSRLRRDPAPLGDILDFYFESALAASQDVLTTE